MGVLGLPSELPAGAWTLPAGKVWGKATYFQQQTSEWYLSNPEFAGGKLYAAGTRRPYRFGGRYSSRAVFVEGAYGITDRLEAGAQFPYFDQHLADGTRLEPPAEAGFGDLRLWLRWKTLSTPIILTLKAAAKAPTGDFRNEDGLIPVGEGQWDFDLVAQLGRSFWPLPLYAALDLGYRVRLENRQVAQDPGDEWLLDAQVGGRFSDRFSLAGKFELLSAETGTAFGFPNPSLQKRIAYFAPTLVLHVLPHADLELAFRQSLGGRNFPAGRQWVVGIASRVE